MFIDHIVVIVSSITKTSEFYRQFLGEPEQQDTEQVVFKIGNTKLFLALSDGAFEKVDKDKGGLNHLAFGVHTVEELKELEKSLVEASIKNSGIQIDKYGGEEFIWFDDPDGYRLEFYLRPR